jgi:hypothetical protein
VKQVSVWQKIIHPVSLRVRLTIGIAVVSALGNCSFAIWTSSKMQQLLIDSHKYDIEQIAARFPRDVEVYSEMSPETALQKAINNLTTSNTLLWVKNSDGILTSNSKNQLSDSVVTQLMSLTKMPSDPQVYQIQGRYFVSCQNSLQVESKQLGTLFVVQDITRDQIMFMTIVQNLAIASILVILMMSICIGIYIKTNLQPLRKLSQEAEVISANDLPKAKLSLDHAPSEVKELAQSFNLMLSRLGQSWEQERQFISNISHELRTPLTIIHGYLQSILRRQSNLTSIQLEALETAVSEAEHTIRLLQDLLDLERADSGYLHFQIQSCILNELVAEVVEMAEKYSQREIKIDAHELIEVNIDYNRLKQVLLNLIDNAIKYSEADTPVTLKLKKATQQAIIEVYDIGDGIPLQHQSRIFDRFYRVDESRTRSTGGTGLGLSIVKTLVEKMGGSVAVRSHLGQGSVFTVTLPLSISYR